MTVSVETIPTETETVAKATAIANPRCPIKDEVDAYCVVVEYKPSGETFEKHSLDSFVRSFDGSEITQERLCDRVYETLDDACSLEWLSVRVQDTKHVNMEVRRGKDR